MFTPSNYTVLWYFGAGCRYCCCCDFPPVRSRGTVQPDCSLSHNQNIRFPFGCCCSIFLCISIAQIFVDFRFLLLLLCCCSYCFAQSMFTKRNRIVIITIVQLNIDCIILNRMKWVAVGPVLRKHISIYVFLSAFLFFKLLPLSLADEYVSLSLSPTCRKLCGNNAVGPKQ